MQRLAFFVDNNQRIPTQIRTPETRPACRAGRGNAKEKEGSRWKVFQLGGCFRFVVVRVPSILYTYKQPSYVRYGRAAGRAMPQSRLSQDRHGLATHPELLPAIAHINSMVSRSRRLSAQLGSKKVLPQLMIALRLIRLRLEWAPGLRLLS
jgi:hypothetical protein